MTKNACRLDDIVLYHNVLHNAILFDIKPDFIQTAKRDPRQNLPSSVKKKTPATQQKKEKKRKKRRKNK